MTQQFTSSEVLDLENRIVQRLSWLREGSPIDMKAFTADIETLLLQAHSAQAQPPAARVPDAETLRLHLGELTPDEVCVAKAAYALALAAQENPNG